MDTRSNVATPAELVGDAPGRERTTLIESTLEAAANGSQIPIHKTAPAQSALLRGTIEAQAAPIPTPFQIMVKVKGGREKKIYFEQLGAGPFELRLDEYIGGADARELSILVRVRAKGYITSSAFADLQKLEPGSQGVATAVYTTTLKPTLVTSVIRGRLLGMGGAKLDHPLVAFLPDERDASNSNARVDSTEPNDQGQFELRLTRLDPGWLIASARGYAVLHVRFDSFAESPIELGDLTLGPGASIKGRALRDGVPLPKGSTVFARLPARSAPSTLRRFKLQVEGQRVAYRHTTTKTDAQGEFELTGLEAGLSYRLVAHAANASAPYKGQLAAGTLVRAPARNVQLDWGLMHLRLQVRSAGKPVVGVEVRSIIPAEGAWKGTHIIDRGGWQMGVRGDSQGSVALLLAKGVVTHFEISAPSYKTKMLPVDPALLPASGEIEVELVPGKLSGILDLHFEGLPVAELEGAMVFVFIFDSTGGLQSLGPGFVRSGVARIEDVPAGTTTITYSLRLPTQGKFDALPFVKSKSTRIIFPPLEAGSKTKYIEKLTLGGRIELTLSGIQPNASPSVNLPPPEFVLINSEGKLQKVQTYFAGKNGQAEAGAWERDGTGLIETWIAPGDYTLRQVGAAYHGDEVSVTIRPSVQVPLHMTLRAL